MTKESSQKNGDKNIRLSSFARHGFGNNEDVDDNDKTN